MRVMLKSKIHRARITNLNIDYEGSITIDSTLMEEADILPYEQVQVLDVNNDGHLDMVSIAGSKVNFLLGDGTGRLLKDNSIDVSDVAFVQRIASNVYRINLDLNQSARPSFLQPDHIAEL